MYQYYRTCAHVRTLTITCVLGDCTCVLLHVSRLVSIHGMYIPITQMEYVFPRLRYVLIHTVHTSSVILASLLYTVRVCVCAPARACVRVCVCVLGCDLIIKLQVLFIAPCDLKHQACISLITRTCYALKVASLSNEFCFHLPKTNPAHHFVRSCGMCKVRMYCLV